MRRWGFGLALGILLAVLVSGCGGNSATPTLTGEEYGQQVMQETWAEEAREQQRLEQQAEEAYQDWLREQGAAPSSGPYICTDDGTGVMLRDDAQCQNKTATSLNEGSPVTVLGQASAGCNSVRTPSGATGYVPTQWICAGAAAPAPATACVIKGNVNFSTGEKIYHVPGQKYYDETVIRPDFGERWFCSEAEAQAAGWRKSRE